MEHLSQPRHHRETMQSTHALGTVVFCIHCFRTLGTETPDTSRETLLANHHCMERIAAQQPAAPPPYN